MPDLPSKVLRAKNVDDALHIVRDHYEHVAHVTFHFARNVAGGIDSPWVRTTYPAAWVGVYVMRQFVEIDPVVRAGITSVSPFDWASLADEPGYQEVFESASQFGIGGNGFSIPIRDRNNRRSLFGLSSNLPDDAWRKELSNRATSWLEIAHVVHKRAVTEVYGDVEEVVRLGAREIECLQWAARGKDAAATAIILGRSEHTIRAHLKTARFKLNCSSISQAVAKAIMLQLLEI